MQLSSSDRESKFVAYIIYALDEILLTSGMKLVTSRFGLLVRSYLR